MQRFHLLKRILKCCKKILRCTYFTAEQNATLYANSWIVHPFIYDSITTEIKDLFDRQSDFGMKALFRDTIY